MDYCCNCTNCPCCPPQPKPEPPCIICPEITKEYASYSQSGHLYNTALLGGLRLDNPPVQTSGFYYDTGIINITKPGTYLVSYIVNFPDNAAANTTLALQMNNVNIPSTVRVIQKTAEGNAYTAAAQAIITVDTITRLRLSSSAVIDITTIASDVVASVSVIQL